MEDRKHAPSHENIVRTIPNAARDVTRPVAAAAPCPFVLARRHRRGRPSPFCDAPAAPGSVYCARHRAGLQHEDRAALAAALAHAGEETVPLPPEFAGLAPVALPEIEPETSEEVIAALPLPCRSQWGETE